MPHELRDGPLLVSDDSSLLDLAGVHAFLTRSYWSPGIPLETLRRGLANSLCIGAYDVTDPERRVQVGFGRAVTDRATYAYVADVFVLESHRARGVSKLIMRAMMMHPDLQGLRRWMLMTRDAHSLYTRFGFTPLARPDAAMERWDPGVYSRGTGSADGSAGDWGDGAPPGSKLSP